MAQSIKILLTILSDCDGNRNILDIIKLHNLDFVKSFEVLKKSLELKLVYFHN